MREVDVDFVGVFAATLVESAIEEDLGAVNFEEVLGAGGSASGTAEFEFHIDSFWY